MIKCPLCGWNNAESTQLCVSCGGDLENRTGLIREEDNPNCYSFTPPRRILNKGVGLSGSGNDLVFKFSNSPLAKLLIILKLLFFTVFPYVGVKLYKADNSLFYVIIPLTMLYMIDIVGWIFFSRGGRKRKRKMMSLGMRFLYAFHVIGMAYCILTMIITIYISLALTFSWDLSAYIGAAAYDISKSTLHFMITLTALILLFIIFLNICAKFFHHTHDVFSKNALKYYRFTAVIAVGFAIIALLGFITAGVIIYNKDYALEFLSRYEMLSAYFYSPVKHHSMFISLCSGLFAMISLISSVMVIRYIRNYKKLFIKEKN